MSFKLDVSKNLAKQVRKAADERLEKAIDALRGAGPAEAAHEARKKLKQVRAVVRLVRGPLGKRDYKRLNHAFRDAGRRLADLRDATAAVETLDKLAETYGDALDAGAVKQVRCALRRRERTLAAEASERDNFAAVAKTLEVERQRLGDWPLDGDGWPLIADGLARVYKRGRKAMQLARDEPTPENLHDWRKRAKYLRYHAKLLRPAFPTLLGATEDALHDLTDLLGDGHDATFLAELLADEPGLADPPVRRALQGVLRRHEKSLRPPAFALGEKLYCEPTKTFCRRIKAYVRTAGPD